MPARFGKPRQSDLPARQWIVGLSLSSLPCVDAERRNGRIQLSGGHPEALCALVEGLARSRIDARIALEWQIVRAVGACARKTVTLDGVGDGVGHAHRVCGLRVGNGCRAMLEASLCLNDRPGKRAGSRPSMSIGSKPLMARCDRSQSAPPSCAISERCSMRRPLRIMIGTTRPQSSARHQRGDQSLPRCSSNAPSLRNATRLSPLSGMCTYSSSAKPR